jgi:hypothetical protein
MRDVLSVQEFEVSVRCTDNKGTVLSADMTSQLVVSVTASPNTLHARTMPFTIRHVGASKHFNGSSGGSDGPCVVIRSICNPLPLLSSAAHIAGPAEDMQVSITLRSGEHIGASPMQFKAVSRWHPIACRNAAHTLQCGASM